MAELNPALRASRFCPRCAQPAQIDYPRRLTCDACGFAAYYNPKPVAAAIPFTPDGRIILLRRAFEPGKGQWTFPGGFVDLGESVEQAAHREAREELGVAVRLQHLVGVYSRPDDPVVLIVFAALTAEEPRTTEEASEVATLHPADVPWDELAFWSTEQALREALQG